ncbi:MAG: hypothetical protein AAFU60_00050 [Bacteroidota bacterium]
MLKVNADRIVAISAMLISLLTLIIFIYQTSLIRQQSRLSVTPRLILEADINVESEDSLAYLTVFLENKGLGPAILEEGWIEFEGEKYPLNFLGFVEEAYLEMLEYGDFNLSAPIDPGTTFSPEEGHTFFEFNFPESRLEEFLVDFLQLEQNGMFPFDIVLRYASIYEEEWEISLSNNKKPKKR